MPRRSPTDGLVRATALLLGFQIVEQLTGFFSQMLLAATFGASARTDAYLLAIAVVGFLQLWTELPLRQVLIAMFRHDLAQRGERAAWRDVSILLNDLLLVFGLLTVVGWLAAPLLVRITATGFDRETAALASSLTRITMATVLLGGLASFLAQVLLSYQRFVLVGLSGIVNNLVFIGALLWLGGRYGIRAAAIGMVLAWIAEAGIQLPVLWQHRRLYHRSVDFRHPGLHELSRLSGPLFVSAGGWRLQRIADRLMASFLAPGSLSALSFANLLIDAPRTLILQPFQQTMIPHFTDLIARGRLGVLSRDLFQYIRFLLFVTVPASAGVMLLSDLVVRAVYKRGAFDHAAVELASTALFFFAIGLPASFIGRVLATTYVTFKDTRTPMRATLLQIVVKVGLALALMPSLALGGIALAESLAQYLRAGCLLWMLPAEVRAGQLDPLARCGARSAVTAIAMCALVYLLKRSGIGHEYAIVHLVLLAGAGAAVYFLMSGLSRQTELRWLGRSLTAIWGRS